MANKQNSDDRVQGTSSTIVVGGDKVDLTDMDVPRDQFGTAVIHRLAAENRERIPFGNDATVATPGLGGPTEEWLGAFGAVRADKVETKVPAELAVEALQPENRPPLTESQVEEQDLALEEAEARAKVEREWADAHDGVLGAGPVVTPESVTKAQAEANKSSKNDASSKVSPPSDKK